MKTFLISINTRHAENIFIGKKKYEIRRRSMKLQEGDVLFIYEPSPKMEITGYIEVSKVIADNKNSLWKKIGSLSGITKKEYLSYLDGITTANAIEISKAEKISNNISLKTIRENEPDFLPPQVYRSLDASLVSRLGLSSHLSTAQKAQQA